MPSNGMNTGVDYSFIFYDSTSGGLLEINDVQDVKVMAQKHDLKNMRYNGPPKYGFVPDGFRIDMTITRTSSVLEDTMVAFEQAFNNGEIIKPGYLNETIKNPDGSTSKYQYTDCVLFLTDHGDVSREKPVSMKLEGMASQKVRLS